MVGKKVNLKHFVIYIALYNGMLIHIFLIFITSTDKITGIAILQYSYLNALKLIFELKT